MTKQDLEAVGIISSGSGLKVESIKKALNYNSDALAELSNSISTETKKNKESL